MKRPCLLLVLVYSSGILLGAYAPAPLPWLFALAAILLAGALKTGSAGSLLWPVLFITGWIHFLSSQALLSPYDLRHVAGAEPHLATVTGRLVDSPELRVRDWEDPNTWTTLATIKVESLTVGGTTKRALGKIAVSTRGVIEPRPLPGQNVRITGVLQRPPSAVADGLFDYRQYLELRGIYYLLKASSSNDWHQEARSANTASRMAVMGDQFTGWARKQLARGLIEDDSLRLLWAMSLGWNTALTNEVALPFMQSGTLHVFAISGLHVALIAGIILRTLRVLGVPRRSCVWFIVPALWLYTAATGNQPSAVRSSVMMSIIVIGWSLSRPPELINSLCVAALLILLWDPRQLFDAGFQLSFGVVASIALFVGPIERALEAMLAPDPFVPPALLPFWRTRFRSTIRKTLLLIAASTAAWLGSLPIVAYYFHLVTPISLIANLLIVPLSSAALASCMGSLACAWILPGVSEWFNHGAWFWMTGMVKSSVWFGTWPGAYTYVKSPNIFECAAYYLFLFSITSGFALKTNARKRLLLLAMAITTTFSGLCRYGRSTDVQITVLPCSGDAIYVDAPGRQSDLLIDGGNASSTTWIVEPFLRAQGLDRLNRLLLTHGDISHMGGSTNLTRALKIGEVVIGPNLFRSTPYRNALKEMERSQIDFVQTRRGDQLGAWRILHPPATNQFSRADDGCLVLLGEFYGTRVLLLSDLGRQGAQELFSATPDLRADILVLGISSEERPIASDLLRAINPKAIIVSCAAYPVTARAKEPLRTRLGKMQVPVFYTSDDGAVIARLTPSEWRIYSAARPK